MPSIGELLNENNSPLASAMAQGVDDIAQGQTLVFTKYVRVVLPLDGFVFWVRADQLSHSALLNASQLNAVALNQAPVTITPAPTVTVKGSLHYATDNVQEEDQTLGRNRVVFTAESQIDAFNQLGPQVLYLASFDGIRFAFSQRKPYYQQAGLFHYVGDAVYPALASQLVDDAVTLDTSNVVVSNSLPIWLGLNQYFPVYPSYLVPDNHIPPYAAVHIEPNSTQAIQSAPALDQFLSHTQLVSEKVKITIYGARNFNALDYQDYLFQYSLDTDAFGLLNMPVVRDEKRGQSELNVLAMKKSLELEVSYYQTRIRNVARQLILSALPTVILEN